MRSRLMSILVELKQVTFHYTQGFNVLEKIDLQVKQGDFVALTGPNGSAKTTLLKIILGLLKAQAGTVRIFGQEISKFKDWYKLGYVPQKTNFFNQGFPASVEEVIWLNQSKRHSSKNKLSVQEEISRVLKMVGLSHKRLVRIGELSGGELQRVLVARALINKPYLLVLDEPTANLDSLAQESLSELLVKLNVDLGLTIILVTHDEKLTVKAKKVLRLEQGILSRVS